MATFNPVLRSRLARCLGAHERRSSDDDQLRHAAVAVALVEGDGGEACFILTRRHTGLRAHAGQWALPGGRVDPGETATQAALRELREEVGLAAGQVLGLLDDYPTRSGYRITPVVVWSDTPATMPTSEAEVSSVHHIRLDELEREDSPRFLTGVADARGPVIQVPIGDSLIHAPTGAVLYQFREVALAGRTTRVAHYDEPPFARR